MAIYLEDLIKDPQRFEELSTKQPRCCNCDVELHESITGKRTTPEGEACSDCYYQLLGELVEEHPIVSAGLRRG